MFALLRRRSPKEATMSKETLSVELDSGLVDRVRRYSEEHGTEVADTIGELIASLPARRAAENGRQSAAAATGASGDEDEEEWVRSLPPITRSLLGIATDVTREAWHDELSPAVRRILGAGAGPADEEDYHRYLLEKYGR